MRNGLLKKYFFITALMLLSFSAFASEGNTEKEEVYNPVPVIMHHISDSHEWHLWGKGEESVSVPLPVILWTDNGLVSFMSSAFHHDDEGHHIVEKKGQKFVKIHDKIYQLNAGAEHAAFNEEHHLENGNRTLDFSITKNVAAMFFASALILLIFFKVAGFYKKNGVSAPKGITGVVEPIIIYIRDEIALVNIGEKKYMKFMPYLLTVFFFILINNILGLIPWIPGGANLTGNIAVTLVLAFFTLIIVNINGNKEYWGHIFWMPGAPWPVKLLLMPIELVGVLTKPFALMIRLFANITAGHIVILSLLSLVFIFKSMAMSLVAVPFALFISVLEILVAFLQAYVFTMLTALFIGTAVAEHH